MHVIYLFCFNLMNSPVNAVCKSHSIMTASVAAKCLINVLLCITLWIIEAHNTIFSVYISHAHFKMLLNGFRRIFRSTQTQSHLIGDGPTPPIQGQDTESRWSAIIIYLLLLFIHRFKAHTSKLWKVILHNGISKKEVWLFKKQFYFHTIIIYFFM